MFGRPSSPDQNPNDVTNPSPVPAQPRTTAAPPVPVGSNGGTVIGADLTILGQKINVVSQGRVQIDGTVAGDVTGREVVIGQDGEVSGTITANKVEVRGIVNGAVNGSAVALLATAKVEGDINHLTLSIAEGAQFNGRVRRPSDANELEPNLDIASLTASV